MNTIFMFGYWGWGSATEELVRSVDAVERGRNFRPPLFVDVRITRNVRASGFRDDAFEKMIGGRRYRWMSGLGNRRVAEGRAGLEIQCPEAAEDLLDLVLESAASKQRIIYFCSCELPRFCHRYTVGKLLLKAARKRGESVQVIEWPGGEPTTLELQVADNQIPKDRSARLYLDDPQGIAKYAGLAFGSLVTAKGNTGERTVAVAPAMLAQKGWYLPILKSVGGNAIKGTARAASSYRQECGYTPLEVGV